jgi:hypothetical protein
MLRHSYGLAKATAPDDDDDSGHRSSKAHMFLMKRRWKETDTRTTNCVKKRSDKRRRKKHYQRKNKTSQQTNKQVFSFPIHTHRENSQLEMRSSISETSKGQIGALHNNNPLATSSHFLYNTKRRHAKHMMKKERSMKIASR